MYLYYFCQSLYLQSCLSALSLKLFLSLVCCAVQVSEIQTLLDPIKTVSLQPLTIASLSSFVSITMVALVEVD